MNISEIRPPWAGWETRELLGRGGFGAVYRIERDNFGSAESAAMKVIRIPRDDSELEEYYTDGITPAELSTRYEDNMQSIVREYALMAKLKGCANVVYCDDVSQVRHADGIGWDIIIRMELLAPVPKALPREYDERTALKLGADIAHALTVCREKNIIHRDVKPQNIFVSEDGVYKLGDFGVAKAVERTTGGTKVGTYKFMAPEVYSNRPYGTGADVYSLGLVLYWFMNERRSPFVPLPPAVPTNAEEEQARARRFDGEPLPAPKHGSKALKALVLRACAFKADERISAEDLMDALEDLLHQEQLRARKAQVSEHPAASSAAVVDPDATVGAWYADSEKQEASAEIPEAIPIPAPEPEPIFSPVMDEAASHETQRAMPTVGKQAKQKRNKIKRKRTSNRPLSQVIIYSAVLAVGIGMIIFFTILGNRISEQSGSRPYQRVEAEETEKSETSKRQFISITVSNRRTTEFSISRDDEVQLGLQLRYDPESAVEWESADPNIATVSNGLVRGVGVGSTVITVTVDGVTAECTVYVTE